MKCPHCGAWSNVLETRTTRRRRECANGHRFSTVEVLPSLVSGREYRRHLRAVVERERIWARDLKIIADPRGSKATGRTYGVSEGRVRQIRARAAAQQEKQA